MKVTSLKDVETYIYSSVIMPLKALNTPVLEFHSPIKGESGNEWLLNVRPEPTTRDYRRNYQRTQAQRKANLQVILYNGTSEYVVASYNRKNHEVTIYERPFRRLAAMVLMSKMYDAFNRNTPFTRVVTKMEAPQARVFRSVRPLRERVRPSFGDEYPDATIDDDTEDLF